MNQAESRRGGFTLVEVIIAMVVLSFGLLAMAASTGYVAAQLRSSTFDTQRNLARQQVIERLRATIFTNIQQQTTAQTVGRYSVKWNVSNPNGNGAIKRVQIITAGPAYRSGQGARTIVTDTAFVDIVSP